MTEPPAVGSSAPSTLRSHVHQPFSVMLSRLSSVMSPVSRGFGLEVGLPLCQLLRRQGRGELVQKRLGGDLGPSGPPSQ